MFSEDTQPPRAIAINVFDNSLVYPSMSAVRTLRTLEAMEVPNPIDAPFQAFPTQFGPWQIYPGGPVCGDTVEEVDVLVVSMLSEK